MSFFSRLFAKLFGRKKKEQPQVEPPRMPYTPTAEYPGIGKFSPPATSPAPVAIPPQQMLPPLVSTPAIRVAEHGFPEGSYEFPQPGSGAWYVPKADGFNTAGPFKSPAELAQWQAAVKARDEASARADREREAMVFTGKYNADSLSNEEAALIYVYSHSVPGMALANKIYWEAGLFGGPRASINRLINRGEQDSHGRRLEDYPDSQLKQDLLAITLY